MEPPSRFFADRENAWFNSLFDTESSKFSPRGGSGGRASASSGGGTEQRRHTRPPPQTRLVRSTHTRRTPHNYDIWTTSSRLVI